MKSGWVHSVGPSLDEALQLLADVVGDWRDAVTRADVAGAGLGLRRRDP